MTAMSLHAAVESLAAACSQSAGGVSATLTPLPSLDQLAPLWQALENRADGSFFTSWSWIGAWLAVGVGEPCLLVSARAGGEIVGLAILTQTRRGFWQRAALSLHRQSGPADDALYIEYNDLLVDRAWAGLARREMVRAIFCHSAPRADEIAFAGATPDAFAAAAATGWQLDSRSRECPIVDLPSCGYSTEDYLSVLSRNTRSQVRRALRLAGEGLAVHRARTAGEQAAAYEDLRALHQAYWMRKGKPGAFASPRFAAFTARLLTQPGVELLRITAGARTLGVLLNFVHRGHVYAYQSGFAYEADNRFKPGLVSHVMAIADSARLGRTAYHFMAGEARYKDSLATGAETLTWLTAYRPGLATAAILGLRKAKIAAKNFTKNSIVTFAPRT
jgi:CelD/BcsL family acetyltransferase involved in cellulose biosynthesis